MNAFNKSPVWMVVSAPSGAGKTTLCNRLLDDYRSIYYSVSCTTRKARPTEKDGVNYHFIDEENFRRKIAEQAFLEHAEVHGSMYGTLKTCVVEKLCRGIDVLMDIDVQGATQIRRYIQSDSCDDVLRRAYVDVFIAPPSIEALRERLIKRGEDAPGVIDRRVQNAQEEMSRSREYDYIVVNSELEEAYQQLRAIYISAHFRVRRAEKKK